MMDDPKISQWETLEPKSHVIPCQPRFYRKNISRNSHRSLVSGLKDSKEAKTSA